ncbi:MAG: hypothetical protein K8U03_02470 [Planctomycetia bacterium]|nr:hypothetical protein [Planctomycetia bacterium]
MVLGLVACALSGRAEALVAADDKADELARLTGEYTAEFYVRTGHAPAAKEALQGLTLEIDKDRWIQNYRGDVAPYQITLDLADDLKAMQLTHQKVKAVRNCAYVLKDGSLTVTEYLGQEGETTVTIWKRKPPIN